MSNRDFPCTMDCIDRYEDCHSTCKDYIVAKIKYEARKARTQVLDHYINESRGRYLHKTRNKIK